MVPIIPRGLLASFDNIACVSTTSPVCSILTSCDIPFSEIVLMRLTRCVNHTDRIRLYQSEIHVIDHMCSLAWLVSLDACPKLDTHPFKEIRL